MHVVHIHTGKTPIPTKINERKFTPQPMPPIWNSSETNSTNAYYCGRANQWQSPLYLKSPQPVTLLGGMEQEIEDTEVEDVYRGSLRRGSRMLEGTFHSNPTRHPHVLASLPFKEAWHAMEWMPFLNFPFKTLIPFSSVERWDPQK